MIADLARPAADAAEQNAGAEVEAVASNAPRRGVANLRGPLDSVGLLPITRLLSDLGSTGDLSLVLGGWQATVSFDRGRMVAAQAEEEFGWAALEVVLLGASSGRFAFTAGPPSLLPNLAAEPHLQWAQFEFLASASAALAPYAPAASQVPVVSPMGLEDQHGSVSIRRSSLLLLTALDGRTPVRSMARQRGTLHTIKALAELRALDLITYESAGVDEALAPSRAAEPAERLARVSMRAARHLSPRWARAVAAVGILGAVAFGVPATLQGVVVNGSSMLPALRPGQFLVVFRPAYLFSGPQRGDIVVFRNPDLGRDNYVKRVIGVPGDQVRVDAGQVIVNGVELDEPYVTQTDDYSFPSNGQPVRVPRNSYFVLGDNRPVSADSHLGWFVRSDQVLGQVWALPVTLAAQR